MYIRYWTFNYGVWMVIFVLYSSFSLAQKLDLLNAPSRPAIRSNNKSQAVDREGLAVSEESLLLLAQSYESKKDYENQIRILRKLVSKNKTNSSYHLQLIRAFKTRYFHTKNIEHKKEVVQTIHQVMQMKNKKHHELAQLEMLSLLQYKEDVKYNNYAILELFQKMVRDFGKKKIYVRGLCEYLYINQFYQQSLKTCQEAKKIDPKGSSNYIYYALSVKDPEQMEKHLKSSAERFPQSALVQVKAGEHFLKQKSYQTAKMYYAKAVDLDASLVMAQLGLAQSLFGMEQFKIAYKHFLKACILDKPGTLWAFKQAKSKLNQKSQFKMAEFFRKGIIKCFHKA